MIKQKYDATKYVVSILAINELPVTVKQKNPKIIAQLKNSLK